jgi:hypothetical protein
MREERERETIIIIWVNHLKSTHTNKKGRSTRAGKVYLFHFSKNMKEQQLYDIRKMEVKSRD